MKDHVTVLSRDAGKLRIRINDPQMFDESILPQAACDPGCLVCRVVSPMPVELEYDVAGFSDIGSFMKQYCFGRQEGYGFLEGLLEKAVSTARAKPVYLDISAVFCTPRGDGFRFAVLPLKTDAWLLQREEMRSFVDSLRQAFRTGTDYEIPGWLQMALGDEQFSLPTVIQGLRELENVFHPRRFPFLPVRPREPFRTREEVIVPVIEYSSMPPLPVRGSEEPQTSERTQVLLALPQKQAVLVDQGTVYELRFETMTIGRGIQADIRIPDESVSALHARITCDQERFYVQDLKSSNGTWLQDKQVRRRMRLKNGMELRLGSRVLRFEQ